MTKRTRIALLAAAAAVLACAGAAIAIVALRVETTFEFQIRDSVSGRWVWDAVMRIQDREIFGFYQSDAGLLTYRFSRLKPGNATLQVAAQGYAPVSLPVSLRRGANRQEKPIDMLGLEIPGLTKFFIFESLDGSDIVAQLRPVGTSGSAVLNHPCMDLWIGCRVSVQVKNGVPVREEVEEGSGRGAELFRGEIPWTWDPAPEGTFRYSARIPGAKIKEDPSGFRVVDYLIVIGDPRKIPKKDLRELMARVYSVDDTGAVAAALDAEKGRLRYFLDTSWNVKARQE